jgi:hypothetical protein
VGHLAGREPEAAVTADRRATPFVTIAGDRALVRGQLAQEAAYTVSPVDFSWAPQWSREGRGWVIPSSAVPDVQAWAQTGGEMCVVHQRKNPP